MRGCLEITIKYAGMAELADALDSGSSESNFMQVRPLLPAPRRSIVNFASIFLFKKSPARFLIRY